MKIQRTVLRYGIPAFVGLSAAVLLFFWIGIDPGAQLKERIPGAERIEPRGGGDSSGWQGKLIKGAGIPADGLENWPQFRGPNRDNISPETTLLARSWPSGGPKVLWTAEVAEGFAGPAIWKGRVFVLDYDREGAADALRCLSLLDGRELWRYTYPVKVKRNHGMSRTVPTITEEFSISLGPKCNLVCVDPLSGQLRWQVDMVKEFGTQVPPWYAGQCPLIDGQRLILGTGGNSLVAALDCATGKVIWQSPNPNHWQMTHSSVAMMEFNKRRMYVYCGSGGVAGISAEDGSILWEYPEWKISIANVPTPVVAGEGRIFLSGGYNAGSLMLQLRESDGKLNAEALFRLKPAVYGATLQTPVFYRNHLFGVRPDGELVCIDLTGKPLWESGAGHRFGSGPFVIADGLIYLLKEDGALTLAEASLDSYKQLAEAKVLEGPDAWAPMALAGGRLVLRDVTRMICLDVRAPAN